ncbi:MAG: hypothetical protein Q8P02_03840, partial [Candidatus Micrarchaeota archaeon]|nr:hypothetical protein [Candidatus Micrarchaeota archaeon]
MNLKNGIRVHFKKEERRDTGRPLDRFGSVWISPNPQEELPRIPVETAQIVLEEKKPQEGYARHVLVHGGGLEPIHLRLKDTGEWEFNADKFANLKSNGNEMEPSRWHAFQERQLISGYHLRDFHSKPETYLFHAELDDNPVQ